MSLNAIFNAINGVPNMDVKAYGVTMFVLLFKYYVCLFIQGAVRYRSGSKSPEDGMKGGKRQSMIPAHPTPENERDLELDYRWQRIVANDLENIPFALIVGLFSILVSSNMVANTVLLCVFTAFRLLHTVAFAAAIQPLRAIFYFVSVCAVWGLAFNGFITVFLQ